MNCSSSEHDPKTCRLCARLRHPSQRETRLGLARLPRQTVRSARQSGGAC